MGYILPIPLYVHYWKIENRRLKVNSIEKVKLQFNQPQPISIIRVRKKEYNISGYDEIKVSPKQYFILTGKGKHINEYI